MDANVVSCNATTAGRTTTVGLVDDKGCLLRPDLLTPFSKTKDIKGVDADLMLYSYLKVGGGGGEGGGGEGRMLHQIEKNE